MSSDRLNQCMILDIRLGDSSAAHRPSDVVLLSDVERNSLLHQSIPTANQTAGPENYGRMIRDNFISLIPPLASRVCLKSEQYSKLKFKLWQPNRKSGEALNSFIALSYRWRWNIENPEAPSTPVPPPLFQAFIDQRRQDEGLWCDQICIPQDDEEQKMVQISLMDAIYKNARAIIVVLNDIEITKSELEAVMDYTRLYESSPDPPLSIPHLNENPPMMARHAVLHFYLKIMSSTWFHRAWCIHELRLGSNHMFLAPLGTASSEEAGSLVIKFTSKFFRQLHQLFGKVRVAMAGRVDERLFMSLQDIFERQNLDDFLKNHPEVPDPRVANPNKFETWGRLCHEIMTFAVAGGDEKLGPELRRYDANKDKISIALNIVGSSLAQGGSARLGVHPEAGIPQLTDDESFRQLILMGLAERDPVMLCTTGARLRLGPDKQKSILSRPRAEDIGSANFGALPMLSSDMRISVDHHLPHNHIELDMIILDVGSCRSAVVLDPSESSRDRADSFVRLCKASNTFAFPASDKAVSQLIANVFHCTKRWMEEVSSIHKIIGFKNLPSVLENLFDADMTVRSGLVSQSPVFHTWAKTVIQFVKALYIFGPPYNPDIDSDTWGALVVSNSSVDETPELQNSDSANAKAMFFAPLSESVVIGIPKLLALDSYRGLHRAWIMRRRGTGGDSERLADCTLLGKCRMFDSYSFERERSDRWQERRMRVFGD
jgi:hypothetical protein